MSYQPLTELIERLETAEAVLLVLRDQSVSDHEATRLTGKVEGVRLALDYAREEAYLDSEPQS